MRNSPLKAFAKKTHSTQSDDPNKKMGYTQEYKKLKRVSFGKKKGTLKKKGLSSLDFDDTIR
mgnify:CR=1 FL=1|tara:strand:+ start:45 stop:230 length:186 start_codon:yes stop_codon:yes gene_type:complete